MTEITRIPYHSTGRLLGTHPSTEVEIMKTGQLLGRSIVKAIAQNKVSSEREFTLPYLRFIIIIPRCCGGLVKLKKRRQAGKQGDS